MKNKKVKIQKEEKVNPAILSEAPLDDVVEYVEKFEGQEGDGVLKVEEAAVIVQNGNGNSVISQIITAEEKIPASEVVIEQQVDDKIIVTVETPKQKAVKLLSAMNPNEVLEYAAKYSINPATLENVAEFLVTKKPASLKAGKIW